MSASWTRRRALTAALMFVVAGLLGATASPQNLGPWLASVAIVGTLFVLLYVLALRYDVSIVPLAIATMAVAASVREGSMQAYRGALAGSLAGAAIVAAIGYVWFRMLSTRQAPVPAATLR